MSSVIRRVVIVALTLAAGRAGCAIGPDYKWPALTPPKQFRGQSAAETSSLADLPWWEVFGDPVLRALIQEALAGNYDLRIAAERVQQARAQSMIAGGGLLSRERLSGDGPALQAVRGIPRDQQLPR